MTLQSFDWLLNSYILKFIDYALLEYTTSMSSLLWLVPYNFYKQWCTTPCSTEIKYKLLSVGLLPTK